MNAILLLLTIGSSTQVIATFEPGVDGGFGYYNCYTIASEMNEYEQEWADLLEKPRNKTWSCQ